jgi:nucleotide-binding universal stress UspA family protein
MSLFKRILVPHDFSSSASDALAVAAELAERHGGRVTVLHVLTPLYSGPGYPTRDEIAWTPPAEIAEDRRVRLERLVQERLGARSRKVECRVVAGEAVPAILAAAKSADVIVMATLGRTGLTHLLIGSVAEKVVRHAPIPVLTIRAAAARRRTARAGRARGRR